MVVEATSDATNRVPEAGALHNREILANPAGEGMHLAKMEAPERVLDPRGFKPTGGLLEYTPDQIPDLNVACEQYVRELLYLAGLKHPFRRTASGNDSPLLAGISLYCEMGSDLGPLLATRGRGVMVGLSLHEGELVGLGALVDAFGYSAEEVLGEYRGSSLVKRDVASFLTAEEVNSSEVQHRLKYGYRSWFGARNGELAKKVGSTDWRTTSRSHAWENLLFIPSASGDTLALDEALSQIKGPAYSPHVSTPEITPENGPENKSMTADARFDVMWLKGSLGYRFLDSYLAAEPWLEKVDADYLRPGSVVLVSDLDRPLNRFFQSRGYLSFESGWPKSNEMPHPTVYLPPDGISRRGPIRDMVRNDIMVAFRPIGGFSIWIKPPSTPPLV